MHTQLQLQIRLRGCVPHPSFLLRLQSDMQGVVISALIVELLVLSVENKFIDTLVCID